MWRLCRFGDFSNSTVVGQPDGLLVVVPQFTHLKKDQTCEVDGENAGITGGFQGAQARQCALNGQSLSRQLYQSFPIKVKHNLDVTWQISV
jgi:hypothetical protein